MLHDINKNTVDFADNCDATNEPLVLPAVSKSLVNGAVSKQVIYSIFHHITWVKPLMVKLVMDNPEVTTKELLEVSLSGPDSPQLVPLLYGEIRYL